MRNVILHEFIALRFKTDRDGFAFIAVNAREALVINDERQRFEFTEKDAGAGGFGDGKLIVERHALRAIGNPQTVQRFD